MASFSLGTVWEETIAFLRRESHLLVPVALALFGPAQILFMMAMGTNLAKPATPNPLSLLVLPSLLLVLYGNLAITRLVLVPGASVGEALSGGIRRVPIALATCLLIGFALTGIALLILGGAALGVRESGADMRASGMAAQVTLLLVIPALILSIRLLMLMPVLAMEQSGVIASIKRAWEIGRGNIARFFGMFMLSMVLNMLVSMICMVVLEVVAGVMRMFVPTEFVTALQMIITGALGALFMLGLTVYVAFIYRKLAAG